MTRRVDLEQAVTEFLETKRVRGTSTAYGITLNQAIVLLKAMRVRRVASIEFAHVHALFFSDTKGWQARRPLPSEATMNNHRTRLAAFFAWCVRMGYMERNFITVDDIPRFKGKPQLKRRFTHAELKLILSKVENPRDLALLACSGYTGNRIGELTALRLSQLNLDRQEIQYWDFKNKAWKWKPLFAEAEDYLTDWLRVYEEWLGEPLTPEMHLFPRIDRPSYSVIQGWTPVSSRTVRPDLPYVGYHSMLNRLLDRIDIFEQHAGERKLARKGQKFHIFRRSIARMMYDKLAEAEGTQDRALRLVQKFLGHNTRAVTEDYIGLDLEQEELNKHVKGKHLFDDDPEPTKAELPDNVHQLRRGA